MKKIKLIIVLALALFACKNETKPGGRKSKSSFEIKSAKNKKRKLNSFLFCYFNVLPFYVCIFSLIFFQTPFRQSVML